MKRAALALPILLGVIVVLWGCSPYQSNTTTPDRTLEERVGKLEKELKTTKEHNTTLTADLKAEKAKLTAAEKDRDDQKGLAKLRGDDLAKAQAELDGVRKGLKELLTRVDAALAPTESGAATVSTVK